MIIKKLTGKMELSLVNKGLKVLSEESLKELLVSGTTSFGLSLEEIFVRIESLDLSANEIEDPSLLSSFHSLKKLALSRNRIKTIPPLCPTLLELDLSHNLIAHLYEISYIPEQISKSKFQDLANLEVLDLSGNQIKQLDSNLFINTPNLRVVNLSQNKIKNNLRCFIFLHKLDLSSNLIEDLSNFNIFLGKTISLKCLNLKNNPLVSKYQNRYTQHILKYIPQLEILNDIDLSKTRAKTPTQLAKIPSLPKIVPPKKSTEQKRAASSSETKGKRSMSPFYGRQNIRPFDLNLSSIKSYQEGSATSRSNYTNDVFGPPFGMKNQKIDLSSFFITPRNFNPDILGSKSAFGGVSTLNETMSSTTNKANCVISLDIEKDRLPLMLSALKIDVKVGYYSLICQESLPKFEKPLNTKIDKPTQVENSGEGDEGSIIQDKTIFDCSTKVGAEQFLIQEQNKHIREYEMRVDSYKKTIESLKKRDDEQKKIIDFYKRILLTEIKRIDNDELQSNMTKFDELSEKEIAMLIRSLFIKGLVKQKDQIDSFSNQLSQVIQNDQMQEKKLGEVLDKIIIQIQCLAQIGRGILQSNKKEYLDQFATLSKQMDSTCKEIQELNY